MDATRRIVTDLEALTRVWESSPLVSRGLGDFDDVFSTAIAERIIRAGIPLSALRVYKNGEQLSKEKIAAEHATGGVEPRADGACLLEHISDGATVIIEHLKLLCPEVADFAATLASEVGLNTYCAAFITPAGTGGLIPHYDTESVFLRQVYGSKQWCVKAPIQRWPVNAWRSTMQLDTEQVIDEAIKKDDCLYIPRGYVHSAHAAEEGSIHITISIIPITWTDVLRLIINESTSAEAFRECIPARFISVNMETLFQQKIATLQMPEIDSLRPHVDSAGANELTSALQR